VTALAEWMLTLPEEGVTAEEYDRMPEDFEGDPDELPVRPQQVLLAVEIMSKGKCECRPAGQTGRIRMRRNSTLLAF
jgi:hypothetical protein